MLTIGEVLLDKGSDVIATLPETTIEEAVRKMSEANVGCLAVEHHEKIIGIFTERDLLRRVIFEGRDVKTTTVEEVMSSPVETCHPDDDTAQAADKLMHHKFRHLLVMDNDTAVGVISLRDINMALRKRL